MIRINMLDRSLDRTHKTCTICFKVKPLDAFHMHHGKPIPACRQCTAERQRAWSEKNKDAISKKYRAYYAANRERLCSASKEYSRQHRDERIAYGKAYYAATKSVRSAKNRAWRESTMEKQLLMKAKDRSREFNVPFSIVEADIHIPAVCPVLGIPIEMGMGKHHYGSPSLDRIVPELGYVPGNIAVVSFRANWIKSNASIEEHERIANWMKSCLCDGDIPASTPGDL